MSGSQWLKGLNPEQCEAVLHSEGPLLILAGAGSGKTTVLVHRTGRLIDELKVKPENICVLTFTNKSARELKKRVADKVGQRAQKIWSGTFHSFGRVFLKKHFQAAGLPKTFSILDQGDSQTVLREIMRDLRAAQKGFDLDRLMGFISLQREGKSLPPDAGDEYKAVTEIVTPRYLKKLSLLGAVDYDELLLRPVKLLKENEELRRQTQAEIKYLMVDEFQDTNGTQMDLLRLILGEDQNLAVVGDDDQSIYGWRGAQVENILQFPTKFKNCSVVKLERNYRSRPEILELANFAIAKNKKRHPKSLIPQSSPIGQKPEMFVLLSEEEEGDFVCREIRTLLQKGIKPEEISILYRSNSQGARIELSLRKEHIPYKISGGMSLFERKEIKDVLAYLRLGLHPSEFWLRRMINVPPRGLGEAGFEKLSRFAADEKISFWKACERAGEADLGGTVVEHIHTFQNWLRNLLPTIVKSSQPGATLMSELERIGYKADLQKLFEPDSAHNRWTLIEIFSRLLDSYLAKEGQTLETVEEYLEAISLRDQLEGQDEGAKVHLMTLHAAKGLEFDAVFLMGLEEDMLPHRSLGADVEEERRLFYVGLTRARHHLILARCGKRLKRNQWVPSAPSRFLIELDKTLYNEFPDGVRPLQGNARDSALSAFLSGLEKKLNPPSPK
ncbi:MAG: UvrD-helicase domain-containing protein [Bdellovibrionota bacterium]